MLRLVLAAVLYALVAAAPAADSAGGSQAPPKGALPKRVATAPAGPTWSQLNAEQHEALAPLKDDWDGFGPTRKKKWLEIAVRYKDLSPEGQQKMHERMPDLARLTPEQRVTARENFKRAYALPAEQRKAITQKFQDLPEEKKRELAAQSRKKTAVRRRGEPAPAAAAKPPAAPAAPAPASEASAAPEASAALGAAASPLAPAAVAAETAASGNGQSTH